MTRYSWQFLILMISASFSFTMLYGKPFKTDINYYELNLELVRSIICLFMMFYIAHIRSCNRIYFWLITGCSCLFFGNNMNILDEIAIFEESYYQEVEDLLSNTGIICAWIGVYKLIQQQIIRTKTLDYEANTDPLTGLLNRRSFNQMANIHEKSEENSYLMLDIDYFKQINDTYGHSAGDSVLTQVAQCIRQCLRKEDRVARWGGEEFLIEINDCNIDTARIIAEKIRVLIENCHFNVGKHILHITVSIGIANVSAKNQNPDEVINLADKSLYQAKHLGRNRVVSADELAQ
ncbi:MAG: GGDEF domain-containing protein [Shewanella sp.]